MTESPISPLLRSARDYLRGAAQDLARTGRPREIAAGYGVHLLAQVLDQVRAELIEHEMAELAAVYDILSILVADALGLMDAPTAFRALAELCGDQDAIRLIAGQPPATPEQLGTLGEHLLWITVTYSAGDPCERACAITYPGPDGQPRAARAIARLRYEDLPERARARIAETGRDAVRYQLYPPVSQAAGPDRGVPDTGRPDTGRGAQ